MENIKEKAEYCLGCKVKPCRKGCPLDNDITEFINQVKQDNYEEAYKIATQTSVLQSICGRICPHMNQCEGSCIRGIKQTPVCIGDIEAAIGDRAIEKNYAMSSMDKIERKLNVAIVGGGPAGLTCAAFLERSGIHTTIYEKYNKLGGILSHGIPEFRLPRDILNKNIDKILKLGIDVKHNQEIGRNLSLEYLKDKYDAVFLAIGANVSWKMGIPGEELEGVYGGNELLEKANHPNYKGKTVIVSGGGNVAMDCARTIKRMGAKSVKVVYRRAEEQMPAEKKEIEDAKNDGVEFLFQNNILKIYGKNKVDGVECIRTSLVKKENDTRLSPVNIEDSNYNIEADYVVMAIGSTVEERVIQSLNLEVNSNGYIQIDENFETSEHNIFAGGDLVGTKSTVAWAAKNGREAAVKIIERLKNETNE